MKSIIKLKNLKGKTALLRAGFDVPIKNGRVADLRRIKAVLPTIEFLMKRGPVVIMAHQGRPGGKTDARFSQKPVALALEKLLKKKVKFSDDCVGPSAERAVKSLKKGEVLLLENLRFHPGEEKNSPAFARALSRLGDVYVDDSFPDAHREHASIVGVPKYLPAYAGFRLLDEIKYLSALSKDTKHPFLFILGGTKFETKLPVLKKFLKKADSVAICGALANQVFKEEGYETGLSLVEDKKYGLSSLARNGRIILPVDVVAESSKGKKIKSPYEISKSENMVDTGPQTADILEKEIKKAKMILWNGPLGKSSAGHPGSTKDIIKAIAKSGAVSVIGGGDTIDLIAGMKMEKKFTFISTGGGAMLDFLAKGTLPGLEALK